MLASRALVLAVFIAIIAWAAARLDWFVIWRQLASASTPYQIGMAVAWIAALFFRPMRLMVLMSAMAPQIKRRYWPMWSADMIAMAMNSVIPMRAGDMTMAFVLRRSLGIGLVRGTSIVLVDRVFDFLTVIVMFMVMLAATPAVVPWAHDATISLGIGLALLVGGLLLAIRFHAQWSSLLDWACGVLPAAKAEKWRERVHEVFDGLAMIDRFSVIAAALSISILMWGSITASYWLGVQAFWPHMTIPEAAFAASVVALSFVVPLAPGGLGVFHGAVVLALSLFGVPTEPALAFAIVAHAFQMGSVLILGIASLLWQGISLRTLAVVHEAQS